jgi:branched-subunit amino acid transport protein
MAALLDWPHWGTLIAILGLAAITVITRGFFLIPERELPMPNWLREGLRYAPLAALAAVVVPEVISTQGRFVSTWADARIWGALAGAAWYFWRRDILGTIVCGMAVFLPLKLTLGW